jgi:hypothetical protein
MHTGKMSHLKFSYISHLNIPEIAWKHSSVEILAVWNMLSARYWQSLSHEYYSRNATDGVAVTYSGVGSVVCVTFLAARVRQEIDVLLLWRASRFVKSKSNRSIYLHRLR